VTGQPRLAWRGAAAIGAIPFLVLALVQWRFLPLLEAGDYAQYILHAEALIAGRPYAETGYIFDQYAAVVGPRAYPPGLPLTLVPLLATFGRDWAILKLLVVVSGIAFLILAARSLTMRGGPWLAAAATAMAAVALESVYATNSILSDLGFAALLWGAIALADTMDQWRVSRTMAVTAIGLAAMSYRLAGLALVPAVFVYWLIARRRTGAGPVIAVATWVAVGLVAIVSMDLLSQFGQTVLTAPTRILLRLSINVPVAITAVSEALLYPLPGNRANDIYHVVAILFAVIGAVDLVRRDWRAPLLWMALWYGMLLLLAPVAVPRYWWPLYPLIAYLPLAGLRVVAGRTFVPRTAEHIAASMGAVLVLAAALSIVRRPAPRMLLNEPDVQALFTALRGEATARPIRVMFVNPRVLTLETGIAAMPFIRGPSDRVVGQLRRHAISHVVAGDLGTAPAAQDTLVTAITRQPNAFHQTYRNASFTVYRFGDNR
jgi:hypothetical protein